MVSGKYSALAGAISREQAMANISNNLANVGSAGFKRMQVSFESILRGEKQTTDAEGINYNRVRQNVTDFSPGPVKTTGGTFDIAIHGSGFFKVLGPDGPLYTRNGAFTLDQNGTLRTQDGYPVLNPGDTFVEIPEAGTRQISINSLGAISLLDDLGNREEVGVIGIFDIDNTRLLERRSSTTFQLQPGGNETLIEQPQIIPGSLELANVNMIEEVGRMVAGSRLYEIYHKNLRAYSTLSEKQEELGTVA